MFLHSISDKAPYIYVLGYLLSVSLLEYKFHEGRAFVVFPAASQNGK